MHLVDIFFFLTCRHGIANEIVSKKRKKKEKKEKKRKEKRKKNIEGYVTFILVLLRISYSKVLSIYLYIYIYIYIYFYIYAFFILLKSLKSACVYSNPSKSRVHIYYVSIYLSMYISTFFICKYCIHVIIDPDRRNLSFRADRLASRLASIIQAIALSHCGSNETQSRETGRAA